MKKKIGVKSIGVKMLLGILPVVVLALLTRLSESASQNLIEGQSNSNMQTELRANVNRIDDYLNAVRTTSTNIAHMVGASYKTTDLDIYGGAIKGIIGSNDLVLGAGIWFEPNVYDNQEKYVGPYWFKAGDNIEQTNEYSNEEYDYFNQDYYKLAAI